MSLYIHTNIVVPQGLEPRLFGTKNRRVASYTKAHYLFFAESEGFEPPVPCGTIDFKSITFDHSDNSPKLLYIFFG